MNWRRGVVIKSERELNLMREAGIINARALAAAISIIEPGVTSADIDAAAADVLTQAGAEPAFLGYPGPYPYPAVTTVSINAELVHGIPGDRKLREGDIVSIDCGSVVGGFVADSALTVGVGEISPKAQRLLEITEQALFNSIQKMQLGNRTGDLSAAMQELVEHNGFNVVREYTSHGVGRNMHEDPQVPNYGEAGKGVVLKAGMTIALEAMTLSGEAETRLLDDQWTVVSRDGELTAHFEHTVALTKNGPWILTTLDENLDGEQMFRYNRYFAGWLTPANG